MSTIIKPEHFSNFSDQVCCLNDKVKNNSVGGKLNPVNNLENCIDTYFLSRVLSVVHGISFGIDAAIDFSLSAVENLIGAAITLNHRQLIVACKCAIAAIVSPIALALIGLIGLFVPRAATEAASVGQKYIQNIRWTSQYPPVQARLMSLVFAVTLSVRAIAFAVRRVATNALVTIASTSRDVTANFGYVVGAINLNSTSRKNLGV